ncbi:MAG: hypothetical protein ACFFCH_10270 [Promethearchaeota archaeon]
MTVSYYALGLSVLVSLFLVWMIRRNQEANWLNAVKQAFNPYYFVLGTVLALLTSVLFLVSPVVAFFYATLLFLIGVGVLVLSKSNGFDLAVLTICLAIFIYFGFYGITVVAFGPFIGENLTAVLMTLVGGISLIVLLWISGKSLLRSQASLQVQQAQLTQHTQTPL